MAKQYIPDWRDPHVTICYTLNLDIVTHAASRGFPVLACIWLHLVTDSASRGFLVLACRLATPCSLTCIWLHLVTDAASSGFLMLAPFDPPTPKTPPYNHEVDRTTPLKFPQYWPNEKVGRLLVGPQYILLLTLFSYTPLRYVRNVAREE